MKIRILRPTLVAILLLPASLWADGGEIEYAFDFDVDSSMQFIPKDAFFPEAQDVVVVATIRNRSGKSWHRLDISIEVGDQPGNIRPSVAADAIIVGRNMPYAAWRDTLELRINGVYAGRPGGNWDVHWGLEPGAVTFRFIEPMIRSGDYIQIRFPVSDRATQWWALRLVAKPARALP